MCHALATEPPPCEAVIAGVRLPTCVYLHTGLEGGQRPPVTQGSRSAERTDGETSHGEETSSARAQHGKEQSQGVPSSCAAPCNRRARVSSDSGSSFPSR